MFVVDFLGVIVNTLCHWYILFMNTMPKSIYMNIEDLIKSLHKWFCIVKSKFEIINKNINQLEKTKMIYRYLNKTIRKNSEKIDICHRKKDISRFYINFIVSNNTNKGDEYYYFINDITKLEKGKTIKSISKARYIAERDIKIVYNLYGNTYIEKTNFNNFSELIDTSVFII